MEEAGINYIAWWGAGLSTMLALVKFYELWKSRFRIDVGYAFCGDIHQGNNIHIRNLSSHSIILADWELFYRSCWWPFKKDMHINSSGISASDLRIAPYSSTTFNFSGQYYFSWNREGIRKRKIYMRLYVVGRSPVLKRVYG